MGRPRGGRDLLGAADRGGVHYQWRSTLTNENGAGGLLGATTHGDPPGGSGVQPNEKLLERYLDASNLQAMELMGRIHELESEVRVLKVRRGRLFWLLVGTAGLGVFRLLLAITGVTGP